MLTNPQSTSVDTFIHEIIDEIRTENSRFNSEMRSAHRERIVLPALVRGDSGQEISSFTRDLSVAGTCLISGQKFSPGSRWTIELYRMDGTSSSIIAECRWTQAFGDCFWLSGWKFLQSAEE